MSLFLKRWWWLPLALGYLSCCPGAEGCRPATAGRAEWNWWECRDAPLGQPAQTIALRQPERLFIIYPRLKCAEKYPLNSARPGPLKDALALLEASFPRKRADLGSRFRVLTVTATNAAVPVAPQPNSASARKFMSEIRVCFRTSDFSRASTELRFNDGWGLRNDLTRAVLNAPVDQALFEGRLDPDFTVAEPPGP